MERINSTYERTMRSARENGYKGRNLAEAVAHLGKDSTAAKRIFESHVEERERERAATTRSEKIGASPSLKVKLLMWGYAKAMEKK